jgi:hypothetical protein
MEAASLLPVAGVVLGIVLKWVLDALTERSKRKHEDQLRGWDTRREAYALLRHSGRGCVLRLHHVGRYGRYAIRIDGNRPGVYRWLITVEGRSVPKEIAADRAEAAAEVSDALDELARRKS